MKQEDLIENSSILEAVDNLSSMAELNVEEFEHQREEKESVLHLATSNWLDLKNEEKTVQSVKNTFKVVHNYLKYIYKKEALHIKDIEVQKGVKSIVALATEAASKVDACVKHFKDKKNVSDCKEFRELIDFYNHKILKRFKEVIESEEAWEEEWAKQEDVADIQRRGLKDLEAVTKDKDYELFFILKEDGTRFYSKNLIRHMRLVADFDLIIGSLSGDDPFLKVKIIQDRIAHEEALFIKKQIKPDLDKWLKIAGKYRENYFVQLFYKSMLALMLASNAQNLLVNKVGRGACGYYADFKNYLRSLLDSMDYNQFIENPDNQNDPFFKDLMSLVHKTCFALYFYKPDYSDALSLLLRVIGRKLKKGVVASLSLWNQVLDDHEALQSELKKFPSGPLFKVLDMFHGEQTLGFDPYLAGDEPSFVADVNINKRPVSLILSAAPLHQKIITKADITGEFLGALRQAKEDKKKFLLLNFEDRTSWKEYERSHSLEELQKNAEFSKCLEVVTLAKQTEFYYQSDEYLKLGKAKEFKKMFIDQISSGETCGFYFSKSQNKMLSITFMEKMMDWIHDRFFGSKKELSRKNRLDFIEIFYNFLILGLIKNSNADYVIFVSKDSVDTSATTVASFYAFMKLLQSGSDWKEEENELFIETIFLRAFLIRERCVDAKSVSRSVSMLSVVSGELEANRLKILKELAKFD
jgi:hypothetical protein